MLPAHPVFLPPLIPVYKMALSDCRILQLRKIEDRRGNLTPIEGSRDIPFEIKRVYYLYDVPGGATRAAHAHKSLHQFFIAMSGSFDIHLSQGSEHCVHTLNRSYYGLYVPPMIWRDVDNFSSNSVCLVLASAIYDESDYIRDHAAYLDALKQYQA
jgi:dTDP-4-dehydrorhamnose 3,5-epimerase-like enzyme